MLAAENLGKTGKYKGICIFILFLSFYTYMFIRIDSYFIVTFLYFKIYQNDLIIKIFFYCRFVEECMLELFKSIEKGFLSKY